MALNRRLFAYVFSTILALALSPAFAQENAGSPIPAITISGTVAGSPVSVTYDRNALEKMEMVSFETSTPWNSGVVKFEGIPMVELLKTAGVSGTNATVTALNDYSSSVPVEDFQKYNVILAVKRDGQYMPVADQGPFFIVYPYDSDPVLQNQPYYGRSVWQVKAISVE
jgi:hypothetical protein